LVGVLGTDVNGEKFLQVTSVVDKISGDKLGPLAMTNKTLGGVASGYQPGVTGASGVNNIGLLVKVWGKVSSPAGDSFVLDDGSGVGVKVVLPPGFHTPDADAFVCVTGISSCETVGGDTVRLLKSIGRAFVPESASYADDTFTGRTTMGFTEDPNYYPWIGDASTTVGGGLLNSTNLSGLGVGSIGDYMPADFTLQTRLRINTPDVTDCQALITMRQGAPNSPVSGGYFLAILPKWNYTGGGFNLSPGWLLMWHDGSSNAHFVATGHLDGANWSDFHDIEINCSGNSWSGKFDGTTIFTGVADPGPYMTLTGGYIGLGTINANVDYDSVHITTP
ncbi:MAG: single stranded DNA-binding domain-containing protein, partial [Armatimonadota bacterium]